MYRVTDQPLVLKLTATKDQEPYVCTQLSLDCRAAQPAVKICPTIYAIELCEEQDQWGTFRAEWFAWLAEYATPLDKYMQGQNVDRQACLKMAMYKQVIVGKHGFLLSDNNLFNFGVLDDTVLIIDMGSKSLQPHAIAKARMNTGAINRWWYKLAWQCTHAELEECKDIWQNSTSLDEVAQKLCNTGFRPLCTRSLCDSVKQPDAPITQTPKVWALVAEPEANQARLP